MATMGSKSMPCLGGNMKRIGFVIGCCMSLGKVQNVAALQNDKLVCADSTQLLANRTQKS